MLVRYVRSLSRILRMSSAHIQFRLLMCSIKPLPFVLSLSLSLSLSLFLSLSLSLSLTHTHTHTHMFIFLSQYMIFNIVLFMCDCAAASLFSAPVFKWIDTAESTHELSYCLLAFSLRFPCLSSSKLSRCLANAVQPACCLGFCI